LIFPRIFSIFLWATYEEEIDSWILMDLHQVGSTTVDEISMTTGSIFRKCLRLRVEWIAIRQSRFIRVCNFEHRYIYNVVNGWTADEVSVKSGHSL